MFDGNRATLTPRKGTQRRAKVGQVLEHLPWSLSNAQKCKARHQDRCPKCRIRDAKAIDSPENNGSLTLQRKSIKRTGTNIKVGVCRRENKNERKRVNDMVQASYDKKPCRWRRMSLRISKAESI